MLESAILHPHENLNGSVGNSKYSVEVVDTEIGFLKLKEQWQWLLETCECATIFLSYEWIYSWWKIFGNKKRLYILVVRGQDDLIRGIAPFYFVQERMGFMTYTALKFLGNEHVGSDYLDIIVPEKERTAVLNVLLHHLLFVEKSWDVALLTDMDGSSTTLGWFKHCAPQSGLRVLIVDGQTCPFLRLPMSDSDLARMRKKTKDFSKRVKIRFHRCHDPSELEGAIECLFMLHQKRSMAIGRNSSLMNESVRAFHRKVMTVLLKSGWLRLFTLSVNGRLLAMLYGFQYNNKFYYYQSGFDPDPTWKAFSPGRIIVNLTIESAMEEGLQEYDFLRGDEPYKFHWAKMSRSTHTVVLTNRSFHGMYYYIIRHIILTLKKLSQVWFLRLKQGLKFSPTRQLLARRNYHETVQS